MSEYLTTETVTYEYDEAGRISKQTTITTKGPDDQEPPVRARAEGGVVVDMKDFRVHRSGYNPFVLPQE